MLGISSEQLHNFLHTEFACIVLRTAFNSLVGKFSFLFLQGENTLFHGFLDGDFVDNNVDLLGEAMDSVDGLFFHKLGHVR